MELYDKNKHDDNSNIEPIDFSVIQEESVVNNVNIKKLLKWFGYFLLFCFIAILIFIGAYFSKMKAMYSNALAIKVELQNAQHELVNRDFETATNSLGDANAKLEVLKSDLSSILFIRWVPYVASQVKAVDALLEIAVDLTDSSKDLVILGDELTKDIRNESLPFSQISDKKKKDIIEKLVKAQPVLMKTQENLKNASLVITKVDNSILLKPLADVVNPLKQYLPVASNMVDQAIPFIQVAPQILGFQETKKYLFLLQNNNELRPTGGFIGTYGILKLKDGSIEELKTDNIYNLDRAFQDDTQTLTPQQVINRPAPKPIEKYLEQRQIALRDANWDPDFPTTAKFAIELYNQESIAARDIEKQIFNRDPKNRGKEFVSQYSAQDFDGVMAMTPQIIEELLKITGPIVVDGIRFTSENFQEELSFRTTYEFQNLGIDSSNRKDIIFKIAGQLKARIFSLPYTRLLDVLQIGFDSLQSKSIIIYSSNEELQNMIVERGWGGEINQDSLDYLFVVDTNLGSLKTDQFIDRFVDYNINKEGDDYIATVKIKLVHNGEFAWNSTRLRSYTRIYVPKGSELISSQGAMFNDKTKNPDNLTGEVDVYDEHGKTVFGAFISVEPKESKTLTFKYKLPQKVKDSIDLGVYNLLFQKQAGTDNNLTLSLNFDKTIKNAIPNGVVKGLFKDEYRYNIGINKDQWIVLKLK